MKRERKEKDIHEEWDNYKVEFSVKRKSDVTNFGVTKKLSLSFSF